MAFACLQELNVAFNSCKHAKAMQLLVQFPDGGDLEAQFWFVDSMCLDRAAAVVGDAEILQPERLRSFGHLFDGVVSVARSGVTMKCSAQVLLLDQLRESVFVGVFELSPIFP